MIAEFDDFCLLMYVVIDEVWHQLAPLFGRPGPAPACSNSELMTMAIVGQCRGWDLETNLISHWPERRDLSPTVPERSRFNRRRRTLMQAINGVRESGIEFLCVDQVDLVHGCQRSFLPAL